MTDAYLNAASYKNLVAGDLPVFEFALCRQTDPEVFFPRREGSNTCKQAISICLECVHRAECLKFALDNEVSHGIWGGVSALSREHILEGRRG